MNKNITAGLAVGVLLLAGAGNATRVERLSLTEIRDQADSIVIALVTYEETRLTPDGKMVWTDYQLSVEEVLRGARPASDRLLSFAGGRAGDRDVGISGVPRLEAGRRYLLFLLADGTPWATPTVGWGQGIFEIVPQRAIDQPELFLSYDGEPLEMSPAGLRRGQLVRRTEQWVALPDAVDPLRAPREAEPEVLNVDGKPIEQPARAQEPGPRPLGQRTFATLDQVSGFVRGAIQEDPGSQQ